MKNKKLIKIKIFATIAIFLLSFLSHFLYNLFPNFLTSLFFPVNESIFEHMKIIATSTIIYSLIDYQLLKKNQIQFNNFPLQLFITSFLAIPLYLIIYLPLYYFIGENLLLNISLLLFIYTLFQIISYKILTTKPISYLNILSIPLIIISYIILIILTYYPPKNYLFYDTTTNSYGIPKEHVNN